MTAFRLPSGGRIDRSRPLRFTFDGEPLVGHAGDTLASALLANGIHLVGRSFKYHRPRGVLAAGAEEPNALVRVDRGGGRVTPNLRATEVELFDGLAAESQNNWPSLRLDLGAATGLFAPFLASGFYYKTFLGPRLLGPVRLWKRLYEPLIRAAAGLGRAPESADPDRYSQRFAHCETLVIGAGEAGIRAALAASEDPARRVILCDEQNEPGGWLRNGDRTWLDEALATLRARPNLRLLARCQAFGHFTQGMVALVERRTEHLAEPPLGAPRERLWQVRAGEVVFATGAIERPLVFPGNDRPGVMLAGAAETYATGFALRPGARAVIATACDSAYGAAVALERAGTMIVAVLDTRAVPGEAARALAAARGWRVETRAGISRTEGGRHLRAVHLARIGEDGRFRPFERVAADLVAMSGGWTPSVHLFSQSRGKLRFDEAIGAFVPARAAPGQNQRWVGTCAGEFSADMAGYHLGPVARGGTGKAFVDLQNDVTVADLELAAREGFVSVEHAKRYTTTGMATDQGKTSNLHAMAILGAATGRSVPEVGHTTFRQPYTPVTFGALAGPHRGALFEPERRTPMHALAEAAGAEFEDVGQWKRATLFRRAGETVEAALRREIRTVRGTVGLFDASTLGKIDVQGPGAAEALDRFYATPIARLAVGRARYALLLNEAGFVIDDGIVARVGPERFHVTTTTGGAARVLTLLEDYLQTEWPDLGAFATSVTEQWAVIAAQGPRARDLIAPFVGGIDLGEAAFPHMAVREGSFDGAPCRLFRVSFTGEAGYEINVPASEGARVLARLVEAARPLGGALYGLEAMHVLRAEKGYMIVGQETDGTVTPDDLGLGRLVGAAKPDFVGQRGLLRADLVAAGRKQLVGLLPERPIEEGAQLVDRTDPPPGTPALGHVTSAYAFASEDRPFALGLLANGQARHGETLWVTASRGTIAARVTDPVFLDPGGARLRWGQDHG